MVFAIIILVHLAIAATLDPHRRHPRLSEHSDCVPPPPRTQPTSVTAPFVEPLKQLVDTTRKTITSLIKHPRPEPWVCAMSVMMTLLVVAIVILSIKLRKLSVQHARTLGTPEAEEPILKFFPPGASSDIRPYIVIIMELGVLPKSNSTHSPASDRIYGRRSPNCTYWPRRHSTPPRGWSRPTEELSSRTTKHCD